MKSPWLIIALGTLGLVVGYSAVVLTGPTAFASGHSCPAKQQELCASGGCDKEKCASGACGMHCPGCQHHG